MVLPTMTRSPPDGFDQIVLDRAATPDFSVQRDISTSSSGLLTSRNRSDGYVTFAPESACASFGQENSSKTGLGVQNARQTRLAAY